MSQASVCQPGVKSAESPELDNLRKALEGSAYRGLRNLACERQEERLVLRGVSSTWHLKQLAQELARKCISSLQIVNDIEVRD